MTEFKIKGVGLDTSNLNYLPKTISDESVEYGYFYTNVNANNGLVVRPLLQESREVRLVVGIDFLDHVSIAIREHLLELGRSYIDVLMIDSGCDWEKYEEEIKTIMESGLVDEIGIKNPEKKTVEELEALRVKFGITYIGINLCPLYYWKSIMDWANSTGITIFSFNPLGGHLSAPSLIDSFSITYLLNFSAFHSDIVFLSGKDIVFSNVNKDYITSLLHLESSVDSNNYIIKKDINKLIKPLKEVGHASIRVGEELFPITEKDMVLNPQEMDIGIGSVALKIDESIELDSDDEVGHSIMSYLEDAYLPEDTKNPKDYMSVVRPKAFELFQNQFPSEKGWLCANVFMGDLYLFSAYREFRHTRWFSPDEIRSENKVYALYYSPGYGFILRNVQNSSLKS